MKTVVRSRPIWVLLGVAVTGLSIFIVGCPPPNGGGPPPSGQFAGAARCQPCHTNIHENWSATLHATALATLEAVGHADDPNCVPCHVTGFGEEDGFVDLASTAALANVQCESCHGPAGSHVMNVSDESLRPPVPVASEVCGRCHTTDAYPQFPQWEQSKHSLVTEVPAEDFFEGVMLSTCGRCHSGDYRFQVIVRGETVPEDLLAGVPREEQHAVECVICHDPHRRTGNAVSPDQPRDYQLRYAEVMLLQQSNAVSTLTNEDRYNLCGRCHRSRGRTWTSTTRGPHESVQGNVFIGEMPMPPGQENTPLVPNTNSTHRFVQAQCATCHMFRHESPSEFAPPIANHTFSVQIDSCSSAPGCHPSPQIAEADFINLRTEVRNRLEGILARLGPPDTWEYSAEGGPPEEEQGALPEEILKVRFLYKYILNDGSEGVHNPSYVRLMLSEAERLLTSIGR